MLQDKVSSVSQTPRVDSAESFMYSFGKPSMGFVNSALARQLEKELTLAMDVINQNASLEDLIKLQNQHQKGHKDFHSAQPSSRPHAVINDLHPAKSVSQPIIKPEKTASPAKANTDSAGNTLLFEIGQVLFEKGDDADSLMIIMDGEVIIYDPETNKEIATIGKGVSFGEQALLQGGMRSASARAKTLVTCLQIPTEPLRQILKADSGILTCTIEALLLQLNMTNQISRLSDSSQAIQTYEVMKKNDMSTLQVQKMLDEMKVSENYKDLKSQEYIFYSLLASDKMVTTFQQAGNVFASPDIEHSGAGIILIDGHIEARIGKNKIFHLGPGSVLGLAEGLKDEPCPWTLKALDHVTMLNVSISKALRALSHANSGIRGIVRYTSDRIIKLQDTLEIL
ncbi:MAG: hypothetical protein EBT07_05830 [Actinobacteria bacterium]|nr:hypothetical protein [Actinomycetota bacterium]